MKKLLIIPILAIFLSCEDDPTKPQPATPIFEIAEAPEFMLGNIDSLYEFRVRAENLDPQPDSIVCQVFRDNAEFGEVFYLYDDGNADSLYGPAFASPTSTDIVPNNGIFTRRVNGQLLSGGIEGEFFFVFTTPGPDSAVVITSVEIANISECIISEFPTITNFEACFDPVATGIRIIHDPQDEIDSVKLWLDGLTSVHYQPSQGDTVWQLTLAPQTFPCIATASNHEFSFMAYSKFGLTCDTMLNNISFVNSSSILSNSTLPDTIFRPIAEGDIDTVLVTVDLEDCELIGFPFYYGTKFSIRRRDRENWTDSTAYFLRDDGTSPDITNSDGTFSVGLTFDRNVPDSLYYFRFYAVECAAPYDTSEFLIDSVQISPQLGQLSIRENQIECESSIGAISGNKKARFF